MRNEQGFTMMELLVSLAIFGVITSFLMASFRTGRMVDELRIAAQVASSSVRQAQTRALSGSTIGICHGGSNDSKICPTRSQEDCPGGACADEVPRGYGVRFSRVGEAAGRAIVFADIDGNRSYTAGEAIQQINLAPSLGVAVSGFEPSGSNTMDIVFTPPRPTTYFNTSTANTVVIISIEHATSGQTRSIRVNRMSGQVSND